MLRVLYGTNTFIRINCTKQLLELNRTQYKLNERCSSMFKGIRKSWIYGSGEEFRKATDNNLTVLKSKEKLFGWKI